MGQSVPFHQKLDTSAEELRDAADRQPDGPRREEMLERANELERQAILHRWANSAELQPPDDT